MRDFIEKTFFRPLQNLFDQLVLLLPRLFGMIMLIVIGLFMGWLVYKIVRKALQAINFDRFCVQIGLSPVLEKGNIRRPSSELLALCIYWLIVLSFFVIGLRTLDESLMAGVFSRFFSYLPNLVVALMILVMGFFFSKFIGRSILIGAVNARIRSARLLSMGVELLLMIFTLSLSLEELEIGRSTIVAAFSILFGGIVLALAIAFGLGGRHLAQSFLEKRMGANEERESREQHSSHL
ncbi:MAG: hypothetical protein U0V70_15345 [Terriglobia bacterium]